MRDGSMRPGEFLLGLRATVLGGWKGGSSEEPMASGHRSGGHGSLSGRDRDGGMVPANPRRRETAPEGASPGARSQALLKAAPRSRMILGSLPRAAGEAGLQPAPVALAQRFWSKVDRSAGPEECWPWTGYKSRRGYGRIQLSHKVMEEAHRVAYRLHHGEIPEGLQIDHLCRNHSCVNPAHLEAVTQRENILRGEGLTAQNARKTHCVNGHPFDEENTRISAEGWRICRCCAAEERARRPHRNTPARGTVADPLCCQRLGIRVDPVPGRTARL